MLVLTLRTPNHLDRTQGVFTNKLLLWDFVHTSGLVVTRLVPQRTVPGSSKLLSDKAATPSYQALCRALKRRNRVALVGPAAIWIVQDVEKNPQKSLKA